MADITAALRLILFFLRHSIRGWISTTLQDY